MKAAENQSRIIGCWFSVEMKTAWVSFERNWNLPFCNKRRVLSKIVLLQHENAYLHTVATTMEAMQQLWFEHTPHPPYSLDLVPLDYHIFSSLKVLHGAVNSALMMILRKWCRPILRSSQKILLWRNEETSGSKKCINLHSDYSFAHSYLY